MSICIFRWFPEFQTGGNDMPFPAEQKGPFTKWVKKAEKCYILFAAFAKK